MEKFTIEHVDDDDDNFDLGEGLHLEPITNIYAQRKRYLYRLVIIGALAIVGLVAYNATTSKSEFPSSVNDLEKNRFGDDEIDDEKPRSPQPGDEEALEAVFEEDDDDYHGKDNDFKLNATDDRVDDYYGMDDFLSGDDMGDMAKDEFNGNAFMVLEEIDRDPTTFTQGFTYANGFLYESAGLYRQSEVRILDPFTGDLLLKKDMEDQYFAEGMTYFGDDKLIQITWKAKTGFIYDALNLDVLSTFEYTTTKDEGWGITYDETNDRFIVSDGSNMLHFWDGMTLEETHRIEVKHPTRKNVANLNELEFWNGLVLSNVWMTNTVYAINPDTGFIVQDMDFSSLWPMSERGFKNDVLNGISVTDIEDHLLFTGKKWPKIYRVKMKMELFE